MGIAKFASKFFKSLDQESMPNFSKVFIDGTYYLLNFYLHYHSYQRKFNLSRNVNPTEQAMGFVTYMALRLNLKTHWTPTQYFFIFDNMNARRTHKWHSGLARKYRHNEIDYNTILAELSKYNVCADFATYDTDQSIFDLVKNLVPNFISVKDGDKHVMISDIAVLSGDSDFLSFSPNKENIIIMDIIETLEFKYVIRNYECILRMNTESLANNYSYLNSLKYCQMCTIFLCRLIGLTHPNDYIACTLWDVNIVNCILKKIQRSCQCWNQCEYNFAEWNNKCAIYAVEYLIDYIEKHENNCKLVKNSFRFISFTDCKNFTKLHSLVQSGEFRFNRVELRPNKDVNFDIYKCKGLIDMYEQHLSNFNTSVILESERNFKFLLKYQKVNVAHVGDFMQFVRGSGGDFFDIGLFKILDQHDYAKFYAILCCSVYMMFFSLVRIFFDTDFYKAWHYYLAKAIWQHFYESNPRIECKFNNKFRKFFMTFVDNYTRVYDPDFNITTFCNIKFLRMDRIKYFLDKSKA
jgi:hypothetical protein